MALTEQQLVKLKKEVDQAKTTVSELKGQKNALLKQLKDDWDCKSVDEAMEKGKEMAKEIEELDTQIEETIEELEGKYNA